MNISNEDFEKLFERLFDSSIRHAVNSIDYVAVSHNLNPYNANDYGKFYKLLRGKVNVDVRILTMLLRNWIFMKHKYVKTSSQSQG